MKSADLPAAELLEASTLASAAGKVLGPFRAAEAPDAEFASSLRFVVQSEGRKPRVCDDAKRSGVNSTAGLSESIRMGGSTGVLDLVDRLLRTFPGRALLAATEDFDAAFA